MSADAWEGKPMPIDPPPREIVMQQESRNGCNCSLCHASAVVGVGIYLAGQVSREAKHHYVCSECVIRMHREVMAVAP